MDRPCDYRARRGFFLRSVERWFLRWGDFRRIRDWHDGQDISSDGGIGNIIMQVRWCWMRIWFLTVALFIVAIVAAGSIAVAADAASGTKTDRAELRRQRKEAAHCQRRVIMNNDGCDGRGKPDDPRTYENFLSKRTTPLAGTQVDSIFYCTGVFNVYSHHGTDTEPNSRTKNGIERWIWKLGKTGPDALTTIVDFGHKHDIEVFWSMRMNDTHDTHDPGLFCKWKKAHPECLMAKKGQKLVAGGYRWSALNYEMPLVRKKSLEILRDVATRYDVEGLELDFCRHPVYFKPQMHGKPVTQLHCDIMTDFIKSVRKMADEVAAERGRPILIAVRVPDSVGYSKELGLDFVRWMEEDLIDLLGLSGYFQLNSWEPNVKLGHKYDVPVYACLNEPRFGARDSRVLRASNECYRGRALEAWNAGADGIYMFNYFNPHSPLWKELGDPKMLQNMDLLYPAGALDTTQVSYWLRNGMKWMNLPIPLPEKHVKLTAGKQVTVQIPVGAALAAKPGLTPVVKLRLKFDDVANAKKALAVKLNAQSLSNGASSGKWIEYSVSPSAIKQGVNGIELSLLPQGKGLTVSDAVLEIRYKPTAVDKR